MTSYLFPEYSAGDELDADDLTLNLNKVEGWTSYTPTLNTTGGTPALGASGFLVGKWRRIGDDIEVIADLNLSGAGVSIVGSSYRISLPHANHATHTAGPLDAASDVIGHGQTRSGTASQALTITAILAGPNGSDTAGGYMIFYGSGSNSSLGSTNFTTSGRLKAQARYRAAASAFP